MNESDAGSTERRERSARIVEALRRLYSGADCELRHRNAFELLVATILSAQCTDARVNTVTPGLFGEYADARALAAADPAALEARVRPTGFFRNKTRALLGLGAALVERHNGEVPDTMVELAALPGVGRKTANVVLGTWFGKPAIPVDTHVTRLAGRLDLTDERRDAVRIERDLQRLIPERLWTFTSHALILHGRRVCRARRPDCDDCALRAHCPWPDA